MASEVTKAYNKERARIKRQITQLSKKGYVFDEDEVLPKKPKKITQSSVNRLRRLKSSELYTKAKMYVDYDTGEILSASEGKQLERERQRVSRAERQSQRNAPAKAVDTDVLDFDVQDTPFVKQNVPQFTPPKAETIGTFDIESALHQYVDKIPDNRIFYIGKGLSIMRDYISHKAKLHSMIDDAFIGENEWHVQNYFIEHEEEIADKIYIITYASGEEDVRNAMGDLFTIIKGSPFTDEESKAVSELNEDNYGIGE